MNVIDPGHRYQLKNLKSSGHQPLQFFKDGNIHGGVDIAGTNCQELVRVLIDRVNTLHEEKPHFVNDIIVHKAREIIALFEIRAIEQKVKKGLLATESLEVGEDGHWLLGDQEETTK